MTMFRFDGFDWLGDDLANRTVLQDMQNRGWQVSSGATVAADNPSVLWTVGERTPIGKSLHLTGGLTDYIQSPTLQWLDSAVGFHILFDTIPTGGPHKLIEFLDWRDGSFAVRSMICLLNGQLRLYAEGEPGAGGTLDLGAGWTPTTLVAGQRYFIHFYSRRNLKILYVDEVTVMYAGGYGGVYPISTVRLYACGGVHIDDLYSTYTQPARWPGAEDTLLPYSKIVDDELSRHKVLTTKPTAEISNLSDRVKRYNCDSIVEGLAGTDGAFLITDIQWDVDLALQMQPMSFPTNQKSLHQQGHMRSRRTQAITNRFFIEGRLPNAEFDYEALGYTLEQISSAVSLTHGYFHIDTVATMTGYDLAPGINFQAQLARASHTAFNVNMRDATNANAIQWHLRIPAEHPLFSMETAVHPALRYWGWHPEDATGRPGAPWLSSGESYMGYSEAFRSGVLGPVVDFYEGYAHEDRIDIYVVAEDFDIDNALAGLPSGEMVLQIGGEFNPIYQS